MNPTHERRYSIRKRNFGLVNGGAKSSGPKAVSKSSFHSTESSLQEREGDHDEYSRYITEGDSPPGSWFSFYRKFGYYWNHFPKTDYTYLPVSPFYNKEIAPGVLVMPNLSRPPIRPRGRSSLDLTEAYFAGSEDENFTASKWPREVSAGMRTLVISSLRLVTTTVRTVTTTIKSVMQVVTTTVKSVTQAGSSVTQAGSSGSRVSDVPSDGSPTRTRSVPCLLLLPLFLLLLLFFVASGGESRGQVVAVSEAPSSEAWHNLSSVGEWCRGLIRWAAQSSYLMFAWSVSCLHSLFYPVPPLNLASQSVPAAQDLSATLSLLNSMKQRIDLVEHTYLEKSERDTLFIEDVRLKIITLEHNLAELKKNLHEVKDITGSRQSVDLTSLKGAIDADLMSGFVSSAIAKYHADQTGQPDFALQSSGGEVVSIRCTVAYSRPPQYYLWGVRVPWLGQPKSPDVVLQPGTMPGDCWAFEGEQGYLVIKLSSRLKITAFTVDHAPQQILPRGHMTSAPRDFQVLGLRELNDADPVHLGNFRFQNNQQSVQTFQAKESEETFELVELQISSNHGHMGYTCLYRFRVHGQPVDVDSVYIGGPL